METFFIATTIFVLLVFIAFKIGFFLGRKKARDAYIPPPSLENGRMIKDYPIKDKEIHW